MRGAGELWQRGGSASGDAEASATIACAARCQPRGEPACDRSLTVRSRRVTASSDGAVGELIESDQRDVRISIARRAHGRVADVQPDVRLELTPVRTGATSAHGPDGSQRLQADHRRPIVEACRRTPAASSRRSDARA